MRSQTALIVGAGVLGIGAVLYLYQKGLAGAAKSAVNAAGDVVGGAVVGVGDVLGIPETSASECEKALAAGDYLEASFKCPAGVFLKGLFGDTPPVIPDTSSPATPSSTGSAAPGASSPAPDFSGGP